MTSSPAYAVAYLREVDVDVEILDYLARIDATLAPYDGRFLVHGGGLVPAEGEWDGDLVVIAFPSLGAARAWYDSPGYQAILPLRVDNSQSIAAIVEGVPAGYQATDKLAELTALSGRDRGQEPLGDQLLDHGQVRRPRRGRVGVEQLGDGVEDLPDAEVAVAGADQRRLDGVDRAGPAEARPAGAARSSRGPRRRRAAGLLDARRRARQVVVGPRPSSAAPPRPRRAMAGAIGCSTS